ncbi:MAG: peptidoglycan DD-metalloendopeptidase family protein [Candidatus Doudnabacteria bacterium]|nr:peptidoglycan DD-metalloendopeptidase family protein [Candidatus Doudnabacteria bacterium]
MYTIPMRKPCTYVTAKILLAAFFMFAVAVQPVSISAQTLGIGGTLEDQLAQIEKDLEKLKKDKQYLQSQINSQAGQVGAYYGEIGKLRGEMENLQIEIAELDLQIKELNINIELLDKEIAETEEQIKENEVTVEVLEVETTSRITSDYMDYRARGRTNVEFLPSTNPNTYFKDSQYKSIIQTETNRSLDSLVALRQQLQEDKETLDENRVNIARQKAMVDEQYAQLDREREELKTKIDSYNSAIYVAQSRINNAQYTLGAYSDQEAKKLAQAEMLRQQIFNSFSSIPAGQYVVRGTQIGRQGNTGWSTGPHLHFSVSLNGLLQNPCNFLPGGFVEGCGGNGALAAPMSGTYYFTSAFYSGYNGDLRCIPGWGCMAHPAIDVANSIWNAPIYAAHDGWLIKGVDEYGALYIVICQDKGNCNSGYKTGYWHLSEY